MRESSILIVDDEPQNLALLRQILSPHYSKLYFSINGTDALEKARKYLPQLILLDVQLPDVDGLTVCKVLKGQPETENIPVIFITGFSDGGNESAGFEAGGVDYITKPVIPEVVLARVNTHLSLVRASMLEQSVKDAVHMVGEAGHYKDTDTGEHIWRMAAYSRVMAQALGWSAEDAEMLEMAATMHDTGKIGIPDKVLLKPGKLDSDEWVVMKTHTQIGFGILSKSQLPLFKMAADIALRHHEKWDGSGYPDGLSRTDIPVSARIVALADVFDALTMARPYKEEWPVEKALKVIDEGRGAHFDPELVDIFKSVLPEILKIKARWDTSNRNVKETTDEGHTG